MGKRDSKQRSATAAPTASEMSDEELDGVSGGFSVELENVQITSFSMHGGADDLPTEEVAFYYNKISRTSKR